MNENDFLRIMHAQLRFYMHIANPEDLSDEEFAYHVNNLKYIREKEANGK